MNIHRLFSKTLTMQLMLLKQLVFGKKVCQHMLGNHFDKSACHIDNTSQEITNWIASQSGLVLLTFETSLDKIHIQIIFLSYLKISFNLLPCDPGSITILYILFKLISSIKVLSFLRNCITGFYLSENGGKFLNLKSHGIS